MEIKVNRREFIQALSLGASFAGKNKVLPALDNVKINVKSGTIKISSNDGELAIGTLYNNAITDYEGEFYVDPKLVLSAIKTLKNEEVVFFVGDMNLEIRHKNGVFSIPLGAIDEYPTPKMDDNIVKAEVSSEILFEWFKEAKGFVSNDELRPIMNGVFLYYKNGEFGVCASDGHKLYSNYIKNIFDFGDVDAVLSDRAISVLLETINNTDNTKIYFGERNIAFRAGDTSLICRKIEGKYPNFKAVIPTNHAIDCECEKNEFYESLNRVITMSDSASLIKMTLDGMECKLSAEDFDFSKKGEDTFIITSLNNVITIGFKGTFMRNCLDVISSDKLLIEMTDRTRAMVIKDYKSPNKTVLLMPMSIN